jgi:hypothetical protein
VLKLMRSLRLVCKVRRKKRYSSYQGEQGVVAPNLLKRQFDADAPNKKWVTDVTEFSVGDQKLYLSPVMDLFDRQIISYAIGSSPNLELANASLREALATLKDGQKPLVHSDQGFQYQHRLWRLLLQNAGAVQSMSRKSQLLRQRRHRELLRAPQRRALQPRPIPQRRRTDGRAARLHPLVQHRKNLHQAQRPKPRSIPR